MMITIEFNGKPEQIAEKITLCEFLREKGLTNPHLILELNGEIFAKDALSSTSPELNDGDRLNVFSLVGGG